MCREKNMQISFRWVIQRFYIPLWSEIRIKLSVICVGEIAW
jgi:hypothetical protein